VGYEASIRARDDDLVVGLDKRTHQVLLYDDNSTNDNHTIPLSTTMLSEGHHEVDLRNDLLDCHIYICSPEVLVSFSDNWDYQDMLQFIRLEVLNRELGNRLFGYVINSREEYAARVHDPHVYHAASRDLVMRWLYPLVLDANRIFLEEEEEGGGGSSSSGSRGVVTTYGYQKQWVYKEEGVNVMRTAVLGKGVVVGTGTTIGE